MQERACFRICGKQPRCSHMRRLAECQVKPSTLMFPVFRHYIGRFGQQLSGDEGFHVSIWDCSPSMHGTHRPQLPPGNTSVDPLSTATRGFLTRARAQSPRSRQCRTILNSGMEYSKVRNRSSARERGLPMCIASKPPGFQGSRIIVRLETQSESTTDCGGSSHPTPFEGVGGGHLGLVAGGMFKP